MEQNYEAWEGSYRHIQTAEDEFFVVADALPQGYDDDEETEGNSSVSTAVED